MLLPYLRTIWGVAHGCGEALTPSQGGMHNLAPHRAFFRRAVDSGQTDESQAAAWETLEELGLGINWFQEPALQQRSCDPAGLIARLKARNMPPAGTDQGESYAYGSPLTPRQNKRPVRLGGINGKAQPIQKVLHTNEVWERPALTIS